MDGRLASGRKRGKAGGLVVRFKLKGNGAAAAKLMLLMSGRVRSWTAHKGTQHYTGQQQVIVSKSGESVGVWRQASSRQEIKARSVLTFEPRPRPLRSKEPYLPPPTAIEI